MTWPQSQGSSGREQWDSPGDRHSPSPLPASAPPRLQRPRAASTHPKHCSNLSWVFEPSTPRDAGSHSAPELGKKKPRLLPRTSSEKLHLLFSLPSCSKMPRPFPKQRRGRVALKHKIPKCCFFASS